MTISFALNDTVINDQSSGAQDDDVTYGSLPSTFHDRIDASYPGTDTTFVSDVQGATQANSVTVSATGGSALTGLRFTDSTGGALDGDDSGLDTVDGVNILLVADSMDPDHIVYGVRANDPTTVVFAVQMVPVFSAGNTVANVTFNVATFEPIDHPNTGDHDDAVSLLNSLKIAAAESTVFSFAGTPSGKNLFTIVEDTGAGVAVVVTPNAEQTILNTSQGGGPTTLGLGNQMIDPDETMVFTFVKDPAETVTVPNLDQTEADIEGNIQFGSLETITGGSVIISQVQGNGPAALKLTACDTNGVGDLEFKGDGFIGGFGDDDIAAITEVRVYNAAGGLVLTATGDVPAGDITVEFHADGTVDIFGLQDDYRVEYDAGNHERLKVTGLGGKFDIGGIGIDRPGGNSAFVGQQIVFEDDGPTAAIALTGTKVVHDESPAQQDSGIAIPGEDNDDDDQPGNPPLAITTFEGNEGLGDRLGWAKSSAAVVSTAGTGPGTDGAGSATLSLELSASDGVDSGIDVLSGLGVSLFKDGDLVVGRVNAAGDTADENGAVAFVIYLDQDGYLTTAQYLALKHPDTSDPDDTIGITGGALFAQVTQTDIEGDSASASQMVDLGYNTGDPTDAVVQFEDDGPTAASPSLGDIEEDDLRPGAGSNSTGIDEDGSIGLDTRGNVPDAGNHMLTFNLGSALVTTPGVDAPASFALSMPATAVLPPLQSRGETVVYDIALSSGVYTLTGYVDSGNTDDELDAGDRKVFTWMINGLGMSTYTQIDQVDHAFEAVPVAVPNSEPTLDFHALGENALTLNLTPFLSITDAEGDPVPSSVLAGLATYTIIDDIPTIGGNDGQIADGLVDFTAASGGGEVHTTGPISLEGLIGSDENDENDTNYAGTKTYTFTAASIAAGSLTPIAGLTPQIVDNGNKVVFYVDDDVVAGFSASDTIYFQNVLGDHGGAGTYTFTVLQNPPPASIEFDFAGTPSGKNLFTIIEDTDAGVAVVVTPFDKAVILNTSQGGGPTTLGLGNQMIDQGETMVFTFVKNPADAFTVPNLDQNGADLEDNIMFSEGLVTITGGELEIAQVQGNSPAALRLTASDTSGTDEFVGASGDGFFAGFGDDAIAPISSVTVFNGTGGSFTWTLLEDEQTHLGGVKVDFITSGAFAGTVEISGIQDDYSIAYEAAGHERVEVTGLGGKFDIGGFNISESQPTQDQKFQFTVAIIDYDGDTSSDTFEVAVDGTGIYDDDTFDLLV